MAAPSRIVSLATSIEQNTRIVDTYINENGLPSPSFAASTPPDIPLPAEISKAKDEALEAMDELQALLLGPMNKVVHDLIHVPTSLTSLHAIAKLDLASKFPPNTTTTIAELAQKSGLHESDCTRLVRHAVNHRLFTEPSPGVVAHSAATSAIATVPLFRAWIEEGCAIMWSSAPHIVPAMQRWPGSEEPSQTAYNLAQHTPRSFFADIAHDASGARAARFADSMSFFQASPALRTQLLVDNYDWSACGVVVDVGGSHGVVAAELVRRYPKLRAVVQDLPEVIAAAPTGVDRVEFQAHDFFTEQPVRDADVYLLRMILHNWGDAYCIRILRQLVPALKPGARIVINDHVVLEPGVLSAYKDRPVRSFDLVMKACFNAKERDVHDWTSLLREADERFVVAGVKRPEGSQLQIVDVAWSG
ncbi:O-methyltransferase-domain-containing protein [Massariosphaeria phaeospora]|uniref:O-methyltransferase-domain-containing protein n=1 Tax=Massariosphaeria phaeospora TaxID=100035 RepID=A0A7C8I285_9PLEO|nr:O-methyltransferase-domain-containing protein [Massariosphaeria phaeospora]